MKKTKIDINCRDNKGCTPLWCAAESGHEQVFRQLLQVPGVDPNCKDDEGQTVLWLLLDNFCDARVGGAKVAMVQPLLVTGKVNPGVRGPDGLTLLHDAVRRKYEGLDLITLLPSYPDTDPDAKCDSGCSPAVEAALNGNWPAVKLLIESGRIDVNQQLPKGQPGAGGTIRDLAAGAGRYEQEKAEIVSLLLSKGDTRRDVNVQDSHGRTPLAEAATSGNVSMATHLLAAPGADPNIRDEEGRTALSMAACKGHVEVVRLLLGFEGITTETKDHHGQTPLSLAAVAGLPDVVAALLAVDGIVADSRPWWSKPPFVG